MLFVTILVLMLFFCYNFNIEIKVSSKVNTRGIDNVVKITKEGSDKDSAAIIEPADATEKPTDEKINALEENEFNLSLSEKYEISASKSSAYENALRERRKPENNNPFERTKQTNKYVFFEKYDRLQGNIATPCRIDSSSHQSLNECQATSLPMQIKNGKYNECWPRLVLLPSYMVSGNGLTRELFTNITDLVTTQLIRKIVLKSKDVARVYQLGREDWNVMADIDVICDNGAQIPVQGRVALMKTHYPGGKYENFAEFHSSFASDHSQLVTHLVRLVRNPGDHIVRQFLKNSDWSNSFCEEGFEKKMRSWGNFHTFWAHFFEADIPKMFLHYEKITNKTTAPAAIQELLDFVGEKESEEGTLEEKVRQIVKEPSYDHGTILTGYCGVDVSRKVHEYTKDLTEEMGYGFNEESGTWYLVS